MKINIFLTIFFLSSNIFATESEITDLSPKEIMEVNLVLFDMAETRIGSLGAKSPCPNLVKAEAPASTKKVGEKGEAECNCKLDKKHESMVFSLLGDVKEQEISMIDGNDNPFNGILAEGPDSLKKYNGDDLGRTFSLGGSYEVHGSLGEAKLTMDSTGFGKYKIVDGNSYDADHHHFLVFRELNTVDLTYKKYDKVDESSKSYSIFDIRFENQTDNGHLARDIQDKWHHSVKFGGKSPRIYHYLSETPDSNNVILMYGLGKEVSKEFLGMKCTAGISGKAGASAGSSGATLAASGRGDLHISPKAMPFLVMSLWSEINHDYKGTSKEGGVEFSFPMKNGSVKIVPFIGFEKHYSSMDTDYATEKSRAKELYSTFGFKVRW